MGDEPPALEPAERDEDELTVTEDEEKGSDGDLTEDEPLTKKRKPSEPSEKKKGKKLPPPAAAPVVETKKLTKKDKWHPWSTVKSKYVPDPVANRAQFVELGWKKRAEYIEKLRGQYHKSNVEHHVRRLPFLDLRNYWLYLENERFDPITGGKKNNIAIEEQEKENDPENEDEKDGEDEKDEDEKEEIGSSNNHRRKKSPRKGRWTNVESEVFMIGNRISFIPSSSATLRPIIQQRRQDGKYLVVDIDHDFEEWVDLNLRHVIEYTEIVWAKVKGHSWWPAQVLREVNLGKPVKRSGNLSIEFCETNEVNSVRYSHVRPFEGCLLEELKDKKKQPGLDEAMAFATKLWGEHTNNLANFEHKRKKSIMQTARDNASPASLLQTKIMVYWPLDHQWYVGTVKQYHLQTRKHFILYEDGQKEWISLGDETHKPVADQGEEGGASDYSKIVLDPSVDEDGSVKYTQKCWECGHSGTRVAGWEVDPQDEMTSCLRCGSVCHIRCFNLSRSAGLLTGAISNFATTSTSTALVTDGTSSPSPSLHSDSDPTKARCRQCIGCETCGEEKDPHKFLTCDVCHFRVHFDCLDPKLSALPKLNPERGGWVCDFCVKCRSCGANSPDGKTVDRKIALLEDKKVEEEPVSVEDKREEVEEKKGGEKKDEKKSDPKTDKTTEEDAPQTGEPHKRKRGRLPKAATSQAKKKGKQIKKEPPPATTAVTKMEDETKENLPPWPFDYTACKPCGEGYIRGDFCPICFVVWFGEGTRPMICCDACGRWVHIECDGMTKDVLEFLELPGKVYHCPECVHRDKLSDLGGLLDHLAELDTNALFCYPVSEESAPGYTETIKSPMDFITIQAKLRDCAYTRIDDFKYDLNLVWRNAKDYNRPNTTAYKAATRLGGLAATLLDKLASKWTKAHKELRSLPEDNKDEKDDLEEKEAVGEVKENTVAQSWIPYYNFFTRNPEVVEADTCLACGSLGDWDYMLFCADCGEATHSFCIYALLKVNSERRSFEWRCPNCVTCGKCEKCDVDDTLMVCDICDAGRHLQCATPALTTVPTGFKCDQCVKCRSCGSTKPGRKKDQWMYNFTLCKPCGMRYEKGKFCPVCDKVWMDTEGDMVECERCSKWVHTKCDDIDADRYAELNGKAVYHCPPCRRRQSAKKIEVAPPPQASLSPWELLALVARIQFRRRRVRRRLLVNARRKSQITRIVDQMDPQDKQYVRINTPFEIWTDLPDVHSKLKRLMDDMFLPHGPCLHADALPLSKLKLKQRVSESALTRAAAPPPPKPPEKVIPVPEMVFPRKPAPIAPAHKGGRPKSNTRACKFCGRGDDDGVEGRLLPYEDMWVHVHCSLWAVECNEMKHGEISKLDWALNKASICAHCQNPGARIKCKDKQCVNCYHFRCAIQAGFTFQSDFFAFCPAHSNLVVDGKKIDSPYQLRKLICIFSKSQSPFYRAWTGNPEDSEADTRLADQTRVGAKKRKRTEQEQKMEEELGFTHPYVFKMGALCVIQLGHIIPLFHSTTHLFPIGFTSKRVFWSYAVPHTRTTYTCRILLPSSTAPPSSSSSPSLSNNTSSSSTTTTTTTITATTTTTTTTTSSSLDHHSPLTSSSCFPLSAEISSTSHSQNPPPPPPPPSPSSSSSISDDASRPDFFEPPPVLPPLQASPWDPSLPVFEIVAEDDPQGALRFQSATQAWVALLEKCGKFDRYSKRSKNANGDTYSFGLSGPHFFGFGHPIVVQMLERLPQVPKCSNYVSANKDTNRRNQGGDSDNEEKGDSEGEESEDLPLPVNASGSARTEGYNVYKTRDRKNILAKKATIGFIKSVASPSDASQAAFAKDRKKMSTERDERDKPISTQYHIMKNRKGRTYVGESSIHEWGLFSGEHLQPHTMVIEYLGELVRQKVADVREKRYEASGEGSCYMFRIDKDVIVDGTKKGNTSRFINHSCAPNCYTKVVLVDGAKKIIVFSNRVINVGDEVTYDYFFAAEDTKNKITCNCGSYNCAGRLN